jgi:hypothetical protein
VPFVPDPFNSPRSTTAVTIWYGSSAVPLSPHQHVLGPGGHRARSFPGHGNRDAGRGSVAAKQCGCRTQQGSANRHRGASHQGRRGSVQRTDAKGDRHRRHAGWQRRLRRETPDANGGRGQRVVETAATYGRIFQTGLQRQSMWCKSTNTLEKWHARGWTATVEKERRLVAKPPFSGNDLAAIRKIRRMQQVHYGGSANRSGAVTCRLADAMDRQSTSQGHLWSDSPWRPRRRFPRQTSTRSQLRRPHPGRMRQVQPR